jgi:hypothetical protein
MSVTKAVEIAADQPRINTLAEFVKLRTQAAETKTEQTKAGVV